MEVTGQQVATAVAIGALVIGYATLVATFRRDRRVQADKDEAKARELGKQTERLNGVIRDVEQVAAVEIPEIKKLTLSNAVAIAGLAAVTTAQTENINRALEMTGERTKLLDRALDKLLEEK